MLPSAAEYSRTTFPDSAPILLPPNEYIEIWIPVSLRAVSRLTGSARERTMVVTRKSAPKSKQSAVRRSQSDWCRVPEVCQNLSVEAPLMTTRCRKEEEGMNVSQVAIEDRPLAVNFTKAAELTSISKSSLRRYAREGKLKTVRCGRRRIVPFTALTELLRNGLGASPETP